MTTYIERVLIVLNPDGSFKGAHAERLTEIRDGEVILAARQEVVPLTADALAVVLPQHADLLSRVLAAETEAAHLAAELNTARQEADAARQDAEAAREEALREAVAATTAAAAAHAARTVTPLQARRALKAAGLLASVQAMVAAAPEDDDIRLAWDWALTWERDSAFVAQLGASLGLTSAQIDDLFTLAQTL